MRNFFTSPQGLLVWHFAVFAMILPLSEWFAATFPSNRSQQQ